MLMSVLDATVFSIILRLQLLQPALNPAQTRVVPPINLQGRQYFY